MPLSDMPSTDSRLGGYAKPLDDQLGTFPISPEDRIKIAGMLMAGAIRRYIVARALTGKPLNWRERLQLIDAALSDAKKFLRSRFARTGEFEDRPEHQIVVEARRDDDPVHPAPPEEEQA